MSGKDFVEIIDNAIEDDDFTEVGSEEKFTDTEGLLPEEIEAAKEVGMIDDKDGDSEDDDNEEDAEDEDVNDDSDDDGEEDGSDNEDEDDSEANNNDIVPSELDISKTEHSRDLDELFEKMDINPEDENIALKKFDKSQKSFYWKWKNDKRKRQEAEVRADKIELRLKLLEKQKVQSFDDLLEDGTKKEKLNRPVTHEELEQIRLEESQRVERRNAAIAKCNQQEAEFASMHEDFYEAAKSAQELFRKQPQYFDMYMRLAEDPNPNANVADFIYRIGKQSMKPVEKKENKQVNKVIKNKKQTSATLPSTESTTKSRKVKLEDLTPEDALKMSDDDFIKLPQHIRRKLMM